MKFEYLIGAFNKIAIVMVVVDGSSRKSLRIFHMSYQKGIDWGGGNPPLLPRSLSGVNDGLVYFEGYAWLYSIKKLV